MRKCNVCGNSYSDTVYVLHKKRCKKEKEIDLLELTNKELRNILEEKGLATYGAKQELVDRIKAGE